MVELYLHEIFMLWCFISEAHNNFTFTKLQYRIENIYGSIPCCNVQVQLAKSIVRYVPGFSNIWTMLFQQRNLISIPFT
jgi:hypothetical protein